MAPAYAVPGIYYEPRPRVEPRPAARTDVTGFVGFEPRLRDGTSPCRLLTSGAVPVGHSFHVDLASFQLPPDPADGARVTVPGITDLPLSHHASSIPIPPGGSIRYALLAVRPGAAPRAEIVVARGPVSVTSEAVSPDDATVEIAAAGRSAVRLGEVEIRRSTDGARVFPTVLPTLTPTRCDDWQDYALRLGSWPEREDGTLLAHAVRAYFANGGARCQVATIRRPRFDDPEGVRRALQDLVGIAGAAEAEATGLERLLLIEEVAIVDVPDLYARRVDPTRRVRPLPPRDLDACFRRCTATPGVRTATEAVGAQGDAGPVFPDDDVREAQRAMLRRCAPERWRVLLLLAAPVALDPATGVHRGPDAERALAWRRALNGTVEDLASSVGAFYHPWVLAQERIGAPVYELPPTSFAAGVIARRDLARGPHVAPANERLVGVVGLAPPVDDAANAVIYESPENVNPLRAFPGRGIEVWGARTLSADKWMRYLPVRRCLSAIERRALAALRPLVFEPNTPILWFQITQAMLGILVPVFEAGALRGETPEEAFYVRCDETNNPPAAVAAGQVLCEIGVAIAAPAEFVVFRVGRREAVVEVVE
jgi:hypothetical protein